MPVRFKSHPTSEVWVNVAPIRVGSPLAPREEPETANVAAAAIATSGKMRRKRRTFLVPILTQPIIRPPRRTYNEDRACARQLAPVPPAEQCSPGVVSNSAKNLVVVVVYNKGYSRHGR